MLKIAATIAGVLLMAGVAYAGTQTLLDQTTAPTIGTTVQPAAATTTTRQEDRSRENELRGHQNEAEDLRGPCDEAEHANDPRCTGVGAAPRLDDDVADDRGDGNRDPGANSGPGERSGHEDAGDSSGHGGDGNDGGGHSGHGGGDD